MNSRPTLVKISYNEDCSGTLTIPADEIETSIWTRLKLAIRTKKIEHRIYNNKIKMNWSDILGILRDIGSKESQNRYSFRFVPEGKATSKIRQFANEIKLTREQRNSLVKTASVYEIASMLEKLRFTKRKLKNFQYRDLAHLLALSNGANYSVPGAGKTTVTFALHMLTRQEGQHFIVVAPKSAFQAWFDIVETCLDVTATAEAKENFTLLTGNDNNIYESLNSGAKRFLISYDLAIRHQSILERHISTTPTHLVLDEAHRMKAGWQSQRGTFFLRIATEPVRRDILTGTPMPQGATDIISQLDFLWPGHNLGFDIQHGKSPKEVLGNLYVRTTKKELKLPKVVRNFIDIEMDPAQLALYSIVRNEFLRDFSKRISDEIGKAQILNARKSVMRLLQLSINPLLALSSMAREDMKVESALVDEILDDGNSSKMRAVMQHAHNLANEGKKCVIWTIFTDTVQSLNSSLAELNPVFIHGGVPSGAVCDPETREGRIDRFHKDQNCFVLVANPAACGEGINLHEACHDAIYADRSYVTTHYLQSIDRIHRLGLPINIETNVHIYRSKAPAVIGSIDMSVSRRLAEKIRNMQKLLDDPDLHEIAFDEEEAVDPVSYDIDIDDMKNLVAEFEGTATELSKEEM